MKYIALLVHFKSAEFSRGNKNPNLIPAPLPLLAGLLFLMLPSVSSSLKASNGVCQEQAISTRILEFSVLPDIGSLLPCTGQFAKDLAAIDWRSCASIDSGWRAAFAVALPIFEAYRNYKNCLRKTYPDGLAP